MSADGNYRLSPDIGVVEDRASKRLVIYHLTPQAFWAHFFGCSDRIQLEPELRGEIEKDLERRGLRP